MLCRTQVVGREQAVDDVRVVLHRQGEELDDAEDRQVVGAAVPGQGVPVLDVVLLELLEPLGRAGRSRGSRPGGGGRCPPSAGWPSRRRPRRWCPRRRRRPPSP